LSDRGHPLINGERLEVFLTNTLEPVEPQANLLVPAISAEVRAAQKVKDRKILVITGNPPYSGISRNMGKAAQALIERYKYVDGKHFGERKHWLQDDYVKFIAFAQKKMDAADEGIIGVITNHSWLDNQTFRGMRQSLMSSFEQIYLFDLHGSAKKPELPPSGLRDENVFDIEQGVAISIFIKRPGTERVVHHADLWGTRLDKYIELAETSLHQVKWTELFPVSPGYLFRPAAKADSSYQRCQSVMQIFPVRSTGVQTSRDQLVIGDTREELSSRMDEFVNVAIPDDAFRRNYFREHRTGRYARGDTRGWNLSEARKWAKDHTDELKSSIRPISYRPFDTRFFVSHHHMIDWPRQEVMQHLEKSNVALLVPRQLAGEGFRHAFVSELPTEMCVISSKTKEQNYVFPLWLLGDVGAEHENFSTDFRNFVDSRFEHHYGPEEILGYIYAVLYAPTYRLRYAEFLRTEFPRILFPTKSVDFDALSELGWELIQVHLLRDLPRAGLAQYYGKGDHEVEVVRYSQAEQAVWINKDQCFKPVPEDVWNFHIGGYQVLDKYLKSRKGRTLTLDEIDHVAKVADSLAFTIAQMKRIDTAYIAAFPAVDS
jgi:predicted helicase